MPRRSRSATSAPRIVALRSSVEGMKAPIRDAHSSAALEAALQFMMSSDIPSNHKAVVIELLTSALRNHETQHIEAVASAHESVPWQEADSERLKALLAGKVANSWQHADELLMQLANSLGRDSTTVRSKAIELGFGASIDFRLAKQAARNREASDES